jgi:seryl-tRNA synthetase
VNQAAAAALDSICEVIKEVCANIEPLTGGDFNKLKSSVDNVLPSFAELDKKIQKHFEDSQNSNVERSDQSDQKIDVLSNKLEKQMATYKEELKNLSAKMETVEGAASTRSDRNLLLLRIIAGLLLVLLAKSFNFIG